MNSINSVHISGRLGRDVELKYTPNGKAVCKFSLAVEESYRAQGSQDWTQKTYWIECELWGKQAELLAADSSKGSLVYVAGRLKTQEWQDKQGNKRSKTFVAVQQGFAASQSLVTSSRRGRR